MNRTNWKLLVLSVLLNPVLPLMMVLPQFKLREVTADILVYGVERMVNIQVPARQQSTCTHIETATREHIMLWSLMQRVVKQMMV